MRAAPERTEKMNKRNSLPALYNPILLSLLTMLFTPILGGLLAARNWEELGFEDRARGARRWVRLTLLIIVAYLGMKVLFSNEPVMAFAGPWMLLVMWAGWFFSTGFRQILHVRGELQDRYERVPFSRPILIGGLGWVLFTMIQMSVNLAVEILHIEPITAAEKPTGVTISLPQGADKPVVTPDALEAAPAKN